MSDIHSLSHYDYPLPDHLIASRPMENRSEARLMVVDRQNRTIEHHHVRDLPRWLKDGDCLVLNDTKVVPARLKGVRTLTGGAWEGLFLEPVEGSALPQDWPSQPFDRTWQRWNILGTTRGKLQPGETVTLVDPYARPYIRLRMEKKNRKDGSWICLPLLDGEPTHESCWEILQQVGSVPIPPYIRKGVSDARDAENYQTVYASRPGAVAAPTAGLHFTPELLETLENKGVRKVFVTLHVGLGTFRPISAENLSHHEMHQEWGSLSPAASRQLQECRQRGGKILAVGTTSVRVLESSRNLLPFEGYTNLFIRPPYTFHAVDALMTNFHLPKSSLLVLVRTFGGDELLQQAYAEAMEKGYRFYSYGDAMLIL